MGQVTESSQFKDSFGATMTMKGKRWMVFNGESINVMRMKDYSWQQRTLGLCSYSGQSLNFVLSNIQPTTPVIWKQIMINVYVNLIILGIGHCSWGKSFKLVGVLMHPELGMG